MKKITMVLLFLVLGSLSFAGILDYSAELTGEFYPELTMKLQDRTSESFSMVCIDLKNVYSLKLSFDIILFKKLFIGGSTQAFMLKAKDTIFFTPFLQYYSVWAFLNLNNNTTIGVEHRCDHHVVSPGFYDYIEGQYTKVYIKLKVSSLEN